MPIPEDSKIQTIKNQIETWNNRAAMCRQQGNRDLEKQALDRKKAYEMQLMSHSNGLKEMLWVFKVAMLQVLGISAAITAIFVLWSLLYLGYRTLVGTIVVLAAITILIFVRRKVKRKGPDGSTET